MTEHAAIIAATRNWLERAVIGLNLCPFAKAVHVRGQIRYVVSDASSEDELLADLLYELEFLYDAEPEQVETTLLIHPQVLNDFLDYNDFLDIADAAVSELDLDGEVQVASFHPDYQFADSGADDMANFSNRAPFPTLHLLRESSVARAVAAFPDAANIYQRNIDTLRALGHAGWVRACALPMPPGIGSTAERRAGMRGWTAAPGTVAGEGADRKSGCPGNGTDGG